MKLILICVCLHLALTGYSQNACIGIQIQTPVVSKPTGIHSEINSSYNALTLKWKGRPGQGYVVNSTYKSPLGKTFSIETLQVNCDNTNNCSVILPFKEEASISWNIRAMQIIDGRTFYSYPETGDFSWRPIKDILAKQDNNAPGKGPLNNELKIYPNPVVTGLNINWISEYTGSGELVVIDAIGRVVKVIPITKKKTNYTINLSVEKFTSGLYLLCIRTRDGKTLNARFVKE